MSILPVLLAGLLRSAFALEVEAPISLVRRELAPHPHPNRGRSLALVSAHGEADVGSETAAVGNVNGLGSTDPQLIAVIKVAGAAGDGGSVGSQGANGAQGVQGANGTDVRGDPGPQGLPGPIGKAGGNGTTGDVGDTGPPGQDGPAPAESFLWEAILDNYSQLLATDDAQNQAYTVGLANHVNDLYARVIQQGSHIANLAAQVKEQQVMLKGDGATVKQLTNQAQTLHSSVATLTPATQGNVQSLSLLLNLTKSFAPATLGAQAAYGTSATGTR